MYTEYMKKIVHNKKTIVSMVLKSVGEKCKLKIKKGYIIIKFSSDEMCSSEEKVARNVGKFSVRSFTENTITLEIAK